MSAVATAILRKGRQVMSDPVLRRWMALRLLGRTPAPLNATPHRPPYLGTGGLVVETPTAALAAQAHTAPTAPISVRLAGATIVIEPGGADHFVRSQFADVETTLSLHRFAWVPLMAPQDDPAWVGAIWRAWTALYGTPDQSWAWHPYTAAERAINLLTFARRHCLPQPDHAAACLAAHAPAIADQLEWFGDHQTSNHCANNGRGLYLLGLALGLPNATEMGATILRHEGRRLFKPSGMMREASSHYHLLLTRQWASIWLAAHAAARPEAGEFKETLRRALSILGHLVLPGRFPLIGDVSPDCPPEHLFGLLPGGDDGHGWTGLLNPDDRALLIALRDQVTTAPAASLAEDGWLRHNCGPWSGLWHAEPEGWSPMPGHGHQDCGGAELHFGSDPLFVDPGRGSYAAAGEADPYVGAGTHSTLTLDSCDPYPPNRPYFAPAFRTSIAAGAQLHAADGRVILTQGGHARLKGVGEVRRTWTLEDHRLTIDDRVEGKGTHRITRRLVTGLPVESDGEAVTLTGASGRRYKISHEGGTASVLPVTIWSAYGEGHPGSILEFSLRTALPWSGRLVVEVL